MRPTEFLDSGRATPDWIRGCQNDELIVALNFSPLNLSP